MEKTFYVNNLINETSPYLLQHAHNPVNWFPWGKAALDKAKSENKLLIISIGYSACHWCHVMELETFEDPEAAEIMNKQFVSVKVDREERPDIDHIYMDAVQLMNQRGGWPLNIFALSDGKPFFGGTYFTRTQWIGLCNEISSIYHEDPKKITEYAEKLTMGLNTTIALELSPSEKLISFPEPEQVFLRLSEEFDTEEGGMKAVNKFPMPDVWSFLLNYYFHTGEKKALGQVNRTLSKMALGGIYDQPGGGFARYSTDPYWKIPHFEKMLYDNAQLISLYATAYQVTKNRLYQKVVFGCCRFLEKELLSPEGGFYSSLDADSEGEEGRYYSWTEEEIREIAGENAGMICDYYGISRQGNWENGKNVLAVHQQDAELAAGFSVSEAEVESIIEKTNIKLLDFRNSRPKPNRDDKILAAWNSLAVIGFVDAWRVFRDEKFLFTAGKTLNFILKEMLSGVDLYRNFKDGKKSIPAFLDDYALLIKALIAFYQAEFEPHYLQLAEQLAGHVIREFYDRKSGYFFFQKINDNELIANKIELADNVIAGSNSIMANNLFLLGKLFTRPDYLEMAAKMLNGMTGNISKYPSWYSNWAKLLLCHKYPFHEIAITGENMKKFKAELESFYLPNMVMAGAETPSEYLPLLQNRFAVNKTLVYVCTGNSCRLPFENVAEAIVQMTSN